MAKRGKKYKKAIAKVDREKLYSLEEAIQLVKETTYTKFDSTVDVAVNLGIDPKQADQNVRGAIPLPHGLGKTARIVVFAKGDKAVDATNAGADFVGTEDLTQKILGGWMDFDHVIATPDTMAFVGRLGKVLGPRGLMPNPKVGTVTFDVTKAIRELKAGRAEFRADKAGIIHSPVGKASFDAPKLVENVTALIDALIRVKPSSAKGSYLKRLCISGTMGPGIKVDCTAFKV